MLVLTRKLMEKLFIGDDICLTVVRLEGGQVRLGIEAPREVPVVRSELVPGRLAARGKAAPGARLGPIPPPSTHPRRGHHGSEGSSNGPGLPAS